MAKGIIDFSQIVSENKTEKTKSDITKEKINQAKIYGQQEIDTFNNIINNAINEIEKLSLFKDTAPLMKSIFIDEYCNYFAEPILKGNKPLDMPEKTYRKVRKNFFYDLIKKYIDKE